MLNKNDKRNMVNMRGCLYGKALLMSKAQSNKMYNMQLKQNISWNSFFLIQYLT